MSTYSASVSVIGTGSMGSAVARQALDSGHSVTVWNRTSAKTEALHKAGASVASNVADAVDAADIVVVLLLNYDIAQHLLWPEADRLAGKTILNLTTGTSGEAEKWASWAEEHDVAYLDGGILATPDLIGQPAALFLLSGSQTAYDECRSLSESLGTQQYVGEKAGIASLYDTAMLTAMYGMFFGFFHGAAVVESVGVTAADLADSVAPFVTAMTAALPYLAKAIDDRNFVTGTEQTLDFTANALKTIATNARERGIDPSLIDAFRDQVDQQRQAGFGHEDVARTTESFR